MQTGLFSSTPAEIIEHRAEADRILKILRTYGREALIEKLEPKEFTFLSECAHPERVITQKMIFWLRDIKDKMLE